MAEATATPAANGPEKHAGGRPRTKPTVPLSTTAPLTSAQVDTTVPFFEQLKRFPDADWSEQLLMYLYRTHPLTDRTRSGGEFHLRKYVKPVDADDVKHEFGSGAYKLILNRWNPQTRITNRLRDHYFTIMDLKFPPKVPLGDWIDDDRNKDWAWAKPYLVQEAANVAAIAAPALQNVNQADLFKAAVAAVKELRPDQDPAQQHSLAAMVITQMQKSQEQMVALANPDSALRIVDKVLAAVAPGNKAGGDDAVLRLVSGQLDRLGNELAAERQFNRELLTKLTTGEGGGKRRGLREEIEDMAAVKDLARDFFGGNRGEKGTDWADVARDVGIKVIETAPLIAQGFALGRAGFLKPVVPPPGADGKTTVATERAQLSPEEQGKMVEAISSQFGGLFDEITPFLVDQFRREMSGMDFRDWFVSDYGNKAYDTLRKMSADTVLGVIEHRKRVAPPHLRTMLEELQPAERVRKFILEFQSDAPTPGDEEDDEPEPGVPDPNRAPESF